MATAMKKTTKKETIVAEETIDDISEVQCILKDESVEEPVVEKVAPKKVEKKKYALTDGIPCRSITQGGLYMHGIKSDIAYKWSNDGDVTEVEYQDLVAAVRSSVSYVMKPYFIIEDKEFVSQFPQLNQVYDSMYSIRDLRSVILDLSPNMMKSTILSLPDGAKESIKHMASEMISNGSLDSVKKIKILDEIFDTKFMLMTEMFS